jgi:UDP-glucose 6-dehydrogenase
VAVLGLAYKAASDVFDGSQSILVANELARRGAEVIAYDSLTTPDAVKALAPTISVVNDLEACLSRARVVVVTLPEPSYADAVRRHALAAAEPLCIYDLWGIVGPMANPEVTLIVTGRESAQIPLASRR